MYRIEINQCGKCEKIFRISKRQWINGKIVSQTISILNSNRKRKNTDNTENLKDMEPILLKENWNF